MERTEQTSLARRVSRFVGPVRTGKLGFRAARDRLDDVRPVVPDGAVAVGVAQVADDEERGDVFGRDGRDGPRGRGPAAAGPAASAPEGTKRAASS